MPLRDILANEGLVRSAAVDDETAKQFDKALKQLMDAADLPPSVKLKGAKSQTAKVPVPKGFESLFEKIEVELRVQEDRNGGLWAQLKWNYRHPSASNGYGIGTVSSDPVSRKAGWTSEAGEHRWWPWD